MCSRRRNSPWILSFDVKALVSAADELVNVLEMADDGINSESYVRE